jgi:hypothetical protein
MLKTGDNIRPCNATVQRMSIFALLKMKAFPVLICGLLLFFSCRKKEPAPEPPEPVPQGTLEIQVVTYDSLGVQSTDHSGVKVSLQNGASVVTSTNGIASFSGLPHDNYAPVLSKAGFDGPPVSISLQNNLTTVTLPCPARSGFTIPALIGQANGPGNTVISFTLDKPLPAGARCRLAILTNSVAGISSTQFETADTISVNSTEVTNLNIGLLPAFSEWVKKLPWNQQIYVSAVPVSFGLFSSNLLPRPVLMGENLKMSDDVQLTKNW